jgi:hypothetical protein
MQVDNVPESSALITEHERPGPNAQVQGAPDTRASRAELIKAAFDKVLHYGLQDSSREVREEPALHMSLPWTRGP